MAPSTGNTKVNLIMGGGGVRLSAEGGTYSSNAFEGSVDEQVRGAPFKDLPHGLFVTAVDLIGHQPDFFARAATPDLPVSRAVRYSMTIPWVWRPLR